MSVLDEALRSVRDFIRSTRVPVLYHTPSEVYVISPSAWYGVYVIDVLDGLLGQLVGFNEVTDLAGNVNLDLILAFINVDAVFKDGSRLQLIVLGMPNLPAISEVQKVQREVSYFDVWTIYQPQIYRVRKDSTINWEVVMRGQANVLITDRYGVFKRFGSTPPVEYTQYIRMLEEELTKYRLIINDLSLQLNHYYHAYTSIRDMSTRLQVMIGRLLQELSSVSEESVKLREELIRLRGEVSISRVEGFISDAERVRIMRQFVERYMEIDERINKLVTSLDNVRVMVEEILSRLKAVPTPPPTPETKPEVKPEAKAVEVTPKSMMFRRWFRHE